MANTEWQLVRGRRAVFDNGLWMLYIGPGMLEYQTKDAQAFLAYLVSKGLVNNA